MIKKPLITKNISTPIKPLLKPDTEMCEKKTSKTAKNLKLLMSCLYI